MIRICIALVAGILVLCSAPVYAQTSAASAPEDLKVHVAENTTFSLLEAIQLRHPRFSITPMEYQSVRTKRLIPDCMVVVAVGAPTSSSGPYIFDETGKIWDLDGGEWRCDDDSCTTSRNEAVSAFLASLDLTISSENDAIDIARLIEELCGTATQLVSIRNNTKNFTLYNPDFFHKPADHERTWKYQGTKSNNNWNVTSAYIDTGKPVSISMPATWIIIVDEAERVKSVHRTQSRIQ